MKPSSVAVGKQVANRLLLVQALITVFISIIALLDTVEASYSALIGGGISFLANAYFARKAFTYSGASSARQIMNSFYQGEAGKFVITAVLFLIALKYVPNIKPIALLLSFFAVHMVYFLSPLLIKNSGNKN